MLDKLVVKNAIAQGHNMSTGTQRLSHMSSGSEPADDNPYVHDSNYEMDLPDELVLEWRKNYLDGDDSDMEDIADDEEEDSGSDSDSDSDSEDGEMYV
jgi:hypothetical protein